MSVFVKYGMNSRANVYGFVSLRPACRSGQQLGYLRCGESLRADSGSCSKISQLQDELIDDVSFSSHFVRVTLLSVPDELR